MDNSDVDKVINILRQDPEVKAILDKGGVIRTISNNRLSMKAVKIGEEPEGYIEQQVSVGIDLGNEHYHANVDVIQEKVLWFGNDKDREPW